MRHNINAATLGEVTTVVLLALKVGGTISISWWGVFVPLIYSGVYTVFTEVSEGIRKSKLKG